MSATLYVFAGPNGSGKSTIIKDYIAFYGLEKIEYICPDIYAQTIFAKTNNVKERYNKVIKFAEYKREHLLQKNESMLIETFLSRTDKIDFIAKAKEKGYKVVSIFVGTSDLAINISRVKKRVGEGGHDVPTNKIKSRFAKSMKNLPMLANVSDELYIYDNSLDLPVLAISIVDKDVFVSDNAPEWTKKVFD